MMSFWQKENIHQKEHSLIKDESNLLTQNDVRFHHALGRLPTAQ